MYFDPTYARALQVVDDAEEEISHHVNVQYWILVLGNPFHFMDCSLIIITSVTIVSILRLKTLIQFANTTNPTRNYVPSILERANY